MGETKIQWTDATWNPVRGCSRVSPGCDHCYAMGQAHRFAGTVNGKPGPFAGLTTLRRGKVDWTGRAVFVPEMLDQPLRWKKPRRIFVNSMSDLFHESLSNEEIAAVFGVMAACPQHTFQVLTKRPKRAAEWFSWLHNHCAAEEGVGPWGVLKFFSLNVGPSALGTGRIDGFGGPWPLPNVHLGVSAEDQKTADERVPLLFSCPAAVRFVSYEPALGGVDFRPWLHESTCWENRDSLHGACICSEPREDRLDWVIVGGESGPGARLFDVQWAHSLVEQCRDAGVACFVKQLGAKPFDSAAKVGTLPMRLADKKGGDMAEWPEVLRVRQFPEARDA